MTERSKHLFNFNADKIAAAAKAEGNYHEERLAYWKLELAKAIEQVKETAKLIVKEHEVTGGSRLELIIDYGDRTAYSRMQESHNKIERHRESAERFKSDSSVYGSQNKRNYDLDADDVHHFRLNGTLREE